MFRFLKYSLVKNFTFPNFIYWFRLIIILVVASACFSLLLWYPKIFQSIKLGERSLYEIISIEDKKIIDEQATELKKELVKDNLLKNYLRKPLLIRNNQENLSSFEKLNKEVSLIGDFFKCNYQKNCSEQWQKLQEEKKIIIKTKYSEFTLKQWTKIKPLIDYSAREILDYGHIGTIDIETLKHINSFANLKNNEINFLKTILEDSLSANIKIDLTKLKSFEEAELKNIEIEYKIIPAKTIIVHKNEIVDKEKYSVLKQLNLETFHKKFENKVFIEGWAYSLLIFACLLLYIFIDGVRLRTNQIFLLFTLTTSFAAYIGFFAYNKPALLPLAGIAMLLTLFFNSSVGYAGGFLLVMLSIVSLELNFLKVLPAFITMFAAVLLSKKASNRADLIKSGIFLSFIQMTIYTLIVLFSKIESLHWTTFLQHGIAGLGTAIFVTFLLPFLEIVFSMINRFRLRELSDTDQPLLKELHDKAPGTFEHTIVVADLAQEAAKRINADYELVRVGVLYHDIGKMVRPTIFIENQFNEENPHNSLEAIESAHLIIKHVEDGLDLAKKANLPESISIFIPTHQGDAKVQYFYNKAKSQNPNDFINEKEFRYPGPKPNSRETGIVMLADTVEAAIRSLKTIDPHEVKNTIRSLVQAKIDDHQLEESGLTESELAILEEVFLECWKNKNHQRVRYEIISNKNS